MWILEHDGDVFNGKRIWLRPGRKFLFGRTGLEAGGFAIANKTVSRKHLTIQISQTTANDAAIPGKRSKVILEDLRTKSGTLVNGQSIKDSVREYSTEDRFEIKLGLCQDLFRITWMPCVLCFSPTKAESKANFLVTMCEQLGPLDIKVDVNYRPAVTHVINTKRNTSKGLQALIAGRYIVTPSFVDDVISAATAVEDSSASLETDFGASWPNALEYLPPRGNEITERSDAAYAPDENRKEIFEGYTFVFYSRPQFDNLLGPVTSGRGKAVYREVEAGVTRNDEFVGYVKNLAGEKGLDSFDDGSEGKGVVVVRYIPTKGDDFVKIDWFLKFARDVSLQLDHRMIEQSEFLDAILNNDASVLRKALEVEPPSTWPQSTMISGVMAPMGTARSKGHDFLEVAMSEAHQEHVSSSVPETPSTTQQPEQQPSAPPTRRIGRSRRAVTSRFKGFDDFEEPETKPDASQLSQENEPTSSVAQVSRQNSSQMNITQLSTQRPSTKRRASPVLLEPEEDIVSQLAPTAQSFKRRKLEEARQRGEATPEPVHSQAVESKDVSKPKRKPREEVDILEHARLQREKAEERAREETQRLESALDGIDIEEIRSLTIIEEMPVGRKVSRPDRNRDTNEAADVNGESTAEERWNEDWNGRKNFKKFRRRGQEDGPRRIHKVIVQLEEVKKKDFGIGDDYWLEDGPTEARSQNKSQRDIAPTKTQSQMQGGKSVPDVFSQNGSMRPKALRRHMDTVEEVAQDDDVQVVGSDGEMPEINQIRASRASRASKVPAQKRAAEENAAARPPAKKLKTTPAPAPSRRTRAQTIDDDSDEGGGFKFGRRRR